MPLYKVEIKEESYKIVDIEANSEDEALEKVEKMYEEAKIVLDYSDFAEVDFKIFEE